jgi:hypothetical protein
MGNIERRVSRLEGAAGVGNEPRHVVRIIAGRDETEDAAVQRYRAEHPDTPDYAMFVVRVIVSPQRREVSPEVTQ